MVSIHFLGGIAVCSGRDADAESRGEFRYLYCRHVMGLEEMPQSICASGGKFFFEDDQQWPDTLLVNYEYPG